MMETSGALMNSKITLTLIKDDSGKASILATPINKICGDRIQINDNIYDLTPEF